MTTPPTIDVPTVRELTASGNGPPLIDVRTPGEFAAALVGAGLTVAALISTCLLGMLLAKLPHNRGPRTTVPTVVAALTEPRT